jgi:heme/copper-type cytochrome/quinol oxidase subunit 2
MQWVYLAIVVLLIPSFSLGYAWLLLLVPLASRAMTQPQKEDDHLPNSQRPSILTGAFPFIVMLAVAIYPFNIAGTAFRVAEFGPNGNTLATPICLLILLVTIWVRPRRAVHGLNNDPGPIRRVLQFPVFLAPLAQISVALLCFSLSYR